MAYTSFERLRTALEHKEPDRVPCDFGAAEVAAINIHTMRHLRAHLGLSPDVEMDKIKDVSIPQSKNETCFSPKAGNLILSFSRVRTTYIEIDEFSRCMGVS